MTTISPATTPDDFAAVHELFVEYAQSLNFELCFQSFEAELASLAEHYTPPAGRVLIARTDAETAGVVAWQRVDDKTCEMKRLYVRPAHRHTGIGRRLVEEIRSSAATAGYATMRLHSLRGAMDAAIALYRSLGFRDIAQYESIPLDRAVYLGCNLTAGR
jgi:ribosomal protein S18 acetylase RimI-like enzyme